MGSDIEMSGKSEGAQSEKKPFSLSTFWNSLSKLWKIIIILSILALAILSIVMIPLYTKGVTVVVQSANTKEEWLEEMKNEFNRRGFVTSSGIPITVKVHHTGSSLNKELQPNVWSPANYFWVEEQLLSRENGELLGDSYGSCTPLTRIPLGIAIWRPIAEALGWPNAKIGWNTLNDLAEMNGNITFWSQNWGESFHLGHGHPSSSNSGRLAIVSAIYAFGKLKPEWELTNEDVSRSRIQIERLAGSVYHLGKIDTDLLDRMVARGMNYLHGVANYESNVVRYNLKYKDNMAAQLAFIYPSEGTFWFNHPYCILEKPTWPVIPDEIDGARKFLDFLKLPENLERMLFYGIRPHTESFDINTPNSPLNLENGVDPTVNPENIRNLPFPSSTVMDYIIETWKVEKKPSVVMLVMDISDSMQGPNLEAAQQAAIEMVESLAPVDTFYLVTFNTFVYLPPIGGILSTSKFSVINAITSLSAAAGTSIYDAVIRCTKFLLEQKERNILANLSYNIIFMSDGMDTSSQNTYQDMMNSLSFGEKIDSIRFYTVALGKRADKSVLNEIATRTNGKLMIATRKNITSVYKDIVLEF